MRRLALLTLAWPLLACPLLGCPAEGGSGADDDDATDATSDDDDATAECGTGSGGSGGVLGLSWLEVDGYGTPGDAEPDYEILVYVPAALDPEVPAPVALLTARRMPDTRALNEQIFRDYLGMETLGDEQGWIVALPLPGPAGDGLNWTTSGTDAAYFDASLDLLEGLYDVDVDRIFMFGSSAGGNATVYLSYEHADRLAAIMNHAGSNPFQGNWPSTPWPDDVAGLFVHGPSDTVVSQASVGDGAAMFEDAGQVTERVYDYARGHDWHVESLNALMADFFGGQCN